MRQDRPGKVTGSISFICHAHNHEADADELGAKVDATLASLEPLNQLPMVAPSLFAHTERQEDAARRLNGTENVRPIAPTDPVFAKLFRQRNDAESINRALEDTMYIRRAHGVGRRRQLVNLLGYALVVNSLSLLRHRRREPGGVPIAA